MNWLREVLLFVLYSGLGVMVFTVILVLRQWSFASQRYLSGLLLAFSAAALTYAAQPLQWPNLLQWLFPIAVLSPMAIAPLMTAYIKAHYEKPKSTPTSYRAFAPLILAFFTFSIPLYVFLFTSPEGEWSFPPWLLCIPIAGVIYLIFSLIKTFRLLSGYRRSIQNEFSNLRRKELQWIVYWVGGIALVVFLDLSIAVIILSRPDWQWMIGINAMIFIGLTGFLSYHAIVQPPNLWLEVLATHRSAATPSSNDKWDQTARDLDQLMEEKKPYLDPNLSRTGLAAQMGVTDKQLSEVLNQAKKQNFYQYVNGFRVKEFCEKIELDEHRHKTLLALAYESGFNSKASFNRIFKEATGQTPRQYLSQSRQ